MRAKKEGGGTNSNASKGAGATAPAKRRAGDEELRNQVGNKRVVGGKPVGGNAVVKKVPVSVSNEGKKRRILSEEESEEEDSDESESDDSHPPRHRDSGRRKAGREEEERVDIYALMGRNRQRDAQRDLDSDSDMEASGAEVLREEQRALVLRFFLPLPSIIDHSLNLV